MEYQPLIGYRKNETVRLDVLIQCRRRLIRSPDRAP